MHDDAISQSQVCLMVMKMWQIGKFQGKFDLDLISQGHQEYDKQYPIISLCYHKFLKVTEI